VGGLDIAVQRRTPIGSQHEIKGWIKAGNQHLDGYHALWYARSRANSTNYERMARQRCVVTAMVKQLDPQTIVLHFSDIAAATKGVFRTDIPQEALASLATLAVKTKVQKITSVNFVPPLIKPWDYDPQVVRDTVAATIAKTEQADEQAGAKPAPSASTGAKPAKRKPTEQAVMNRPGSDPDANTSDLAGVCSVS
jgi:anionic cell wall polymer biosynthesis LytR-Cps2A-Psr (LCP) family protein